MFQSQECWYFCCKTGFQKARSRSHEC